MPETVSLEASDGSGKAVVLTSALSVGGSSGESAGGSEAGHSHENVNPVKGLHESEVGKGREEEQVTDAGFGGGRPSQPAKPSLSVHANSRDDFSRKAKRKKSAESMKSIKSGVMGDAGRELVCETESTGMPQFLRPPLFKPLTDSAAKVNNGSDEDQEQFVWSGSPDAHTTRSGRSLRSFSGPSLKIPTPTLPVPAINIDQVNVEYAAPHTPTGALPDTFSNDKRPRSRSQGPRLKRSGDFKAPMRRSNQGSSSMGYASGYGTLPSRSGGYAAAAAEYPYTPTPYTPTDPSSHLALPMYGPPSFADRRRGSAASTISTSSFGRERDLEAGEGDYLLGSKRGQWRRRREAASMMGEFEDEGRSGPKRRTCTSFVLLLVIAVIILASPLILVRPLSNVSFRVDNILATPHEFDFDVFVDASNTGMLEVQMRRSKVEVWVTEGPMSLRNITSPPSLNKTDPDSRPRTSVLLGTFTHFASPSSIEEEHYPTFAPMLRTLNETGHVAMKDVGGRSGKA
ncbi:hypothetical protein HK104_009615 [Borealophlyctis nickersoniae]|nr:hypothetical protein HK104_009615 [Borealophlyctis nickersoniae]